MQHRGEQTHRGGFAVGAGDQCGWYAAQIVPRHLLHGRQCIQRPTAPSAATAQGQQIVIQHGWNVACVRGVEQGQQFGPAFGARKQAQGMAGGIRIGGQCVTGRKHLGLAACTLPCPLIDFGCAEQLIDGCRQRQ
jgi:hypothetical protein